MLMDVCVCVAGVGGGGRRERSVAVTRSKKAIIPSTAKPNGVIFLEWIGSPSLAVEFRGLTNPLYQRGYC